MDQAILNILEDEDGIEHDIRDAAQFRDFIYDTVVTTELILKRFKNKATQPNTDATVAPSFSTKINIPTVALKRFDGDPCKWQTFWESFGLAVHKDESLPGIMKFHHLNSLPEGKAAATIGGLSVSGSTYKEAIKLLENRYGQKDNTIASHIEKLYNLPAVKNTDIKRLLNMFDKMETHVRGLKALGVATEQYDKLLIPLLQPKFPNDIQGEISRNCGSDAWNLKALMDALRTEIEARERCVDIVIRGKDSATKEERRGQRPPPTTAAFYTAERRTIGSTPLPCIFCKGQHKMSACQTVESILQDAMF